LGMDPNDMSTWYVPIHNYILKNTISIQNKTFRPLTDD
jgi:hypothetical protein